MAPPMPGTVTEDFRRMDPVAYVRPLGLQPEDSYGFVPMRVDEGAATLFIYRDRPEYERAHPKLAAPEEATRLGPIRIEPTQRVEMEIEGDQLGGALDQIVAQARQMQQMRGASPAGSRPRAHRGTSSAVPTPSVSSVSRSCASPGRSATTNTRRSHPRKRRPPSHPPAS